MTEKTMDAEQIENSLTSLVGMLAPTGFAPYGQQISQQTTLFDNLRWYMVSNQRQLLSQMYVEHGIVQTLCDQPVDDGFRPGFDVKTGQLDGEQIEQLEYFAEQEGALHAVMQAVKWARLYGGGAVVIVTPQNPSSPLDITKLKEGTPIRFVAVDMWELYYSQQNLAQEAMELDTGTEFYDYYGIRLHRSRVLIVKGKEAPAFIRPRLRGWGMSEVERMVRSLNSYLKNQDVVFEILDEAKVDVYKMKGFNNALLTANGTNGIAKRIQHANMLKNFQNALTMDKEDEYDQKQLSFSGLGEILLQIRQGVAADVKMPMTKLFGISAAGFSSGEDDIENYNAMIEGEVRAKTKSIIVTILQICSQIKFGFMPDDIKIMWKPLRILSAEQEETVKDKQFSRLMIAYQSGIISPEETKESLNKASLLPIEIEVTDKALPPLDANFNADLAVAR